MKPSLHPPFIHQQAICESKKIGFGTRVWAFAHVLPNALIGEDCNICDHVFIENDVVLGDRVTVKCGVQIWDGARIGNDVFIGPNVTFTNDKFPRSKKYPEVFGKITVGNGASIGANATILPNINIGEGAMIGAGAVVTRSVPRGAIVVGNPARITGYADTVHFKSQIAVTTESAAEKKQGLIPTLVPGVTLHKLPTVSDLRGDLVVGEFERQIPFPVKRFFMIHGVESGEVRGEHAHRSCHQFLICTRGAVSVIADNGDQRVEVLLDQPSLGIYLPPMIWGIQYRYSKDAVLLVFASDYYDPDDYIRNYTDFLKEVSKV
jgi:acetyltransferase-like isoleucine patch superfamily enzyme/dTDP-4-dehydrorhamnose 3,5-epimerase-like enzyme